jgi:hypothetical protein
VRAPLHPPAYAGGSDKTATGYLSASRLRASTASGLRG